MNMVTNVMDYIKEYDEEIGQALELELGRQRRNLELIASENIVSPAVMLLRVLQYVPYQQTNMLQLPLQYLQRHQI